MDECDQVAFRSLPGSFVDQSGAGRLQSIEVENIEETQIDHNAGLQLEGIVVNQFNPRSNLPQRVVAELKAEGLPVLEPMLGSSVVVKESHEASAPLIHYRRSHKLTDQFVALHNNLGLGA